MTLPPDPPIDEIRDLRRKVSAACGHDPAKLVEYYMRLQEQYKDRLVGEKPPADKPGNDAA